MINFKKLFRSFSHAFKGIALVFQEEQNFRIQIFITFAALFAAILFKISKKEFLFVIISFTQLLVLEIINTAIEKFIDIIKPRVHHYAAIIKDIIAAAVFLSAISTAIIIIFIYYPYIQALLN